MNELLFHLLPIGAVVCYLFAAVGYISSVRFRSGRAPRVPRLFALLGCLQHGVFLIEVALLPEFGGAALYQLPGTLSLVSLLIFVLFLSFESRFALSGLGVFVAPLALAFMLWSAIAFHLSWLGATTPDVAGRRDILIPFHWGGIVLGISLLVLASVTSVGVIIQETLLKARRFTTLQQKLPPLVVLDRVQFQLLALGVLALGCGVGIGIAVGGTESTTVSLGDPAVMTSFLTLAVYGATLIAQLLKGIHGRRAAWLSVCGFVTIILSFITVEVFQSSFHVF